SSSKIVDIHCNNYDFIRLVNKNWMYPSTTDNPTKAMRDRVLSVIRTSYTSICASSANITSLLLSMRLL
ncbi:MAG: hypothetical protein KAV83_02975, partial [Desulfobacterales bacterium]|nr:hypothetical protein [Desulfobacterales bacterium]